MRYAQTAVLVVGKHLAHDVLHHAFQLVDEAGGTVVAVFDFAQLLFPQSGQFCTFQQFLLDEVYQLSAGGCGVEDLALLTHVASAEQGLDDGSSCGGASDAVLLQGITQLLVFHHATGGFHGAEQCGFGVGLGWLSELLSQVGAVRTALASDKGRQGAFLV